MIHSDTIPKAGEKVRFMAGDECPTWLLDLEPWHAQATRAPIRFTVPVDVFDLGDRYVVLPLFMGASQVGVLVTEAQGCNIFAATKETRVVTAEAIVHAEPTRQMSPMEMPLLSQVPPKAKPSEPLQEVREVGVVERLWTKPLAGLAAIVGVTAFVSWGLHALRIFG